MLKELFTNGKLEAAPSKAEVLGDLCDRLNFDGEAAAQLHKQLYREKLTSLVEKKKLTGGSSAFKQRCGTIALPSKGR
jgi:hypothetical protein